jgi:uncharacterized membrane protein YesL
LIRIASGKKWIEMVIYICMLSCAIVMGGTGMYLFFQCSPVQYVLRFSFEKRRKLTKGQKELVC